MSPGLPAIWPRESGGFPIHPLVIGQQHRVQFPHLPDGMWKMELPGSSFPGLLCTQCGCHSWGPEVLNVSPSKVQPSLEVVPCLTFSTTCLNLRSQVTFGFSLHGGVYGVAPGLALFMGTERPHQLIPTALQSLEMFSMGRTCDPSAHLSSLCL